MGREMSGSIERIKLTSSVQATLYFAQMPLAVLQAKQLNVQGRSESRT
jgi:hypothetical protein